MAQPLDVGQVVDGRYELEAVIGRGGMGAVFRARHVFTNQRVALKILTDTLDADAGARFLAEARAASTIGHPAIVHVSDANRTPDGQLYLVMELLAGKPLRLAMQQPADQIQRIGIELLDALSAAHARGVIHRDLKPENIFMVAPGGAVKVLDFGIAKMIGSGLTTHGHMLGTIEYMAPEQLHDSAQVTNRADLWAVGVILYELIAGVRPFGGQTREDKYRAVAMEEPMPIEEVVPVGPDVAAFFARALARDPAQRFPAAFAMADALRHLRLGDGAAPTTAGGQTLGTGSGWNAGPAPATVSTPPAPASRRGLVIVGAIGVVGIAAAITFALVSGKRAEPAADAALTPDAAVPTPADAARVLASDAPPSNGCKEACRRLENCNLALPTCQSDCMSGSVAEDCLLGAENCDDRTRCVWTKTCGTAPAGARSCSQTADCMTTCGLAVDCVCRCAHELRPTRSSWLMARKYTCLVKTKGDAKQFEGDCFPFRDECAEDK